MRRIKSVLVVILGTCLAACGGGKAVTKEVAAATTVNDKTPFDGVMRGLTQGQLAVAHYASGDGTIGLVLDRTGKTPKLQLDGEKEITELTMVEDTSGSRRVGWYLRAPDGRNVIYLSTNGWMEILRGRDRFALTSDAAAKPLPPATITGQWVAAKSEWDRHVETLTPLALRTRFAQFAPEDSGNIAKVAEAMALVTPDMLVRLAERGTSEAHWSPASPRIGTTDYASGSFNLAPSDTSWSGAKAKGGLAKWGGDLDHGGVHFGRPSRPRMYALKGWAPPLALGTPGFIWEIEGSTVVFITLDGGRYEMGVGNVAAPLVEKGAGASSSWPAPLQHALVDMSTVHMFAKAKAVPEDVVKEIDALDAGFSECVDKVWKTAKDDAERIEASSLSANDKWGRLSGIAKSAEQRAPKACAPELKKLEARLVTVIDTRNRERVALHEKAKSRFK